MQSKKKRNNYWSISELWEDIKQTNIHVTGVLERFEESFTENTLNLRENINPQIQKVQQPPSKGNKRNQTKLHHNQTVPNQ